MLRLGRIDGRSQGVALSEEGRRAWPHRRLPLSRMDKRLPRSYVSLGVEIRLGIAQLFTGASLLVVAGLVALSLMTDWSIALVPGLTCALAIAAVYAGYRHYVREKRAPGFLDIPTRFRVVDSRGVCPFGYRKGDFVTVTRGRLVVPQLCPLAEAVLRLAADTGGEVQVQEWCCPVYEHLLVFRRELLVA